MAKVILTPSEGKYTCLNSLFVAVVGPLNDENSFKEIYDSFKKTYPKADHYPYAYRLVGHAKSSDDGEPGSSAGRPLLSLLEEKDINGYIIVARYFGGTKLGIPRLRRSILEAANLAIASAKLGQEKQVYCYEVEVDYSLYQELTKLSAKYGFRLTETDFGMKVKTTIVNSDKLFEVFQKIGLNPSLLGKEEIKTIIEEEQ